MHMHSFITIYSVYRHLVYTPPSSHTSPYSTHYVCTAYLCFHVPGFVPRVYIHVCICISHVCICHYPPYHLSVCAVTQHATQQSTSKASAPYSGMNSEHSQLLAAEPLGASTTREPPVCLVFSSNPTPPPHSIWRGHSFSAKSHKQGTTVRKATDPSEKLPLVPVKHVYVPVLTLHNLAGGMNSEWGFWRHAGLCRRHDFGFLSQPCKERDTCVIHTGWAS